MRDEKINKCCGTEECEDVSKVLASRFSGCSAQLIDNDMICTRAKVRIFAGLAHIHAVAAAALLAEADPLKLNDSQLILLPPELASGLRVLRKNPGDPVNEKFTRELIEVLIKNKSVMLI